MRRNHRWDPPGRPGPFLQTCTVCGAVRRLYEGDPGPRGGTTAWHLIDYADEVDPVLGLTFSLPDTRIPPCRGRRSG